MLVISTRLPKPAIAKVSFQDFRKYGVQVGDWVTITYHDGNVGAWQLLYSAFDCQKFTTEIEITICYKRIRGHFIAVFGQLMLLQIKC